MSRDNGEPSSVKDNRLRSLVCYLNASSVILDMLSRQGCSRDVAMYAVAGDVLVRTC